MSELNETPDQYLKRIIGEMTAESDHAALHGNVLTGLPGLQRLLQIETAARELLGSYGKPDAVVLCDSSFKNALVPMEKMENLCTALQGSEG